MADQQGSDRSQEEEEPEREGEQANSTEPGATGTPNAPAAGTPGSPEVLDLTDELPPPVSPSGTTPTPPISLGESFDAPAAREQMRGVIALILLSILAMVVAGAFLTLWTGWGGDGLRDILQLLLAPVIALVGAVTGFYYGSQGITSDGATRSQPGSSSGGSR